MDTEKKPGLLERTLTRYSESVEKHPVLWWTVSGAALVAVVAMPTLSNELVKYRQMQNDVLETLVEVKMLNDVMSHHFDFSITRGTA